MMAVEERTKNTLNFVLAEINTVAAAFSDQLIEKSDYCRSCSSFFQAADKASFDIY
jgi:hypothetical protein